MGSRVDRRRRRRSVVFGVILCFGLSLSNLSAAQGATVTLGPSLSPEQTSAIHLTCMAAGGCTFAQAAPRYVSPVSGMIVRWRVVDSTGPLALRIIDGKTGGATGATENVSSTALQEFPANLSIKAGQEIGLDLPEEGASLAYANLADTAFSYWNPALGVNEDRAPKNTTSGFQLLFNADVQPSPGIAGLNPPSGSIKAASSVVISGHDFTNASAVSFGSTTAAYKVDSDTQITATAPISAKLGSVPVSVTTVAGTATSPTRFTYTGCKVPKLKGKRLKAAKKQLKKADCKLGKFKGTRAGKVVKQSIKAGKIKAPATKVNVQLG